MKDEILEALKLLDIDSDLVNEIESPQLTTYCFNLKDSRCIRNVNQKAVDVIVDYLKKPVELHKGGSYSFTLSIAKEVPDLVDFKKIEQPKNSGKSIKIIVGQDVNNKPLTIDFNKVNHMLVAGATGSGKTVFVDAMLNALIKSVPNDEFDLKLIDPKRVSFNAYKNIANVDLITEMTDASKMFDNMIALMEERYEHMEKTGETDKNIFKPVFIVVDELAELMLVDRGGCEKQLIRLLQKARQANIHIILATQRPTTDVISGLVKAQCDTRVCLKMASYKDSITVIDKGMGQRLLGRGDAYIKFPYEVEERRFQTAYISDEDIKIFTTGIAAKHPKKAVVEVRRSAAIMHAQFNNIQNEHVRAIAIQCVKDMRDWGFDIPENLEWKEERSKQWLGLTLFDRPCIILNARLYTQDQPTIERTIYHELCHIAVGAQHEHDQSWVKAGDVVRKHKGYWIVPRICCEKKYL